MLILSVFQQKNRPNWVTWSTKTTLEKQPNLSKSRFQNEYERAVYAHYNHLTFLSILMQRYLRSLLKRNENCAMEILYQVAKALKMDSDDIDLFEEGMQDMRMNYYPPCPQTDLVIGLTPHSDSFGLTLLQVNEIKGLQIRKDEVWIPLKPLPNAFVTNVGDILKLMTNHLSSLSQCDSLCLHPS